MLQRLAAKDLDLRGLIMPISDQAYEAGVVAGDSTFWHGFLIAPMNPLERQLPPGGAPHSARHRVRPPLVFAGARKCRAYHHNLSRSRSFWQMPDPDEARNYKSAVPIDV